MYGSRVRSGYIIYSVLTITFIASLTAPVKGEDTFEKTVAALQSRDMERTTWAIVSIGYHGYVELTPEVRSALTDPSESVRREAISTLGILRVTGSEAAAVRMLDDAHEQVRAQAAVTLGDLAAPDAAARIMPLLKDISATVRSAVAESLGRLHYQPAVPALLAMLEDGESEVVGGALRGLAAFTPPGGEEAIERLLVEREQPEEIWILALNALSACGLRNSGPTVERALADKRESVQVAALMSFMQTSQAPHPDRLGPLLRNPNPGIRTMTLMLIGELCVAGLEEQVMALIQDGDSQVCAAAARAAGRLKILESKDMLQRILGNLENAPELRVSAAMALGDMGATESAGLLMRTAEDEDALVRHAALRSLGHLGGPIGEDVLQQHRLHDSSELCRVAALVALARQGKFPEEDAASRIVNVLGRPVVSVSEVHPYMALVLELPPDIATSRLAALAKSCDRGVALSAIAALNRLRK